MKHLIKDQCERNREKVAKSFKKYEVARPQWHHHMVDQITQQTAEAVLSTVREMVEGKRKEWDDHADTPFHDPPAVEGYNHAIDDLLTQLKANQDV